MPVKHRRLETGSCLPHGVPSQLKILIPVGTPTAIVVIVKKLLA